MKNILMVFFVCFIFVGVSGISGCIGLEGDASEGGPMWPKTNNSSSDQGNTSDNSSQGSSSDQGSSEFDGRDINDVRQNG